MLKIRVSPELSMNSSSPEPRPLRRLMASWSKCGRFRCQGRFIWHDVGVLATYGSYDATGAKV